MKKYTNNLIKETSPYLLQHAHNPVNWYPWGEEAFALARKENKPVFLSVGYSSCHWCHVMEHESFENEEIARVMNSHFVNIKVDREERPDIDQLYMHYIQLTTGSGGWPMSVFLTPDQKPFYGGTYFPPQDGYGRPAFKRVLQIMADYFHKEKDKLSDNLAEFDRVFLKAAVDHLDQAKNPDVNDWNIALQTLATFYESKYGGIGGAPKFPAVTVFNLFLRHYKVSRDENYLQMIKHTLTNMANGGIYDQLAGGFARYSVDEKWLVPHFEKMLYDNGQLVGLYLDTYVITKDHFYLDIAEETLDFISRDMLSPDGGFYSSLDADSDGEEGKYYVWSLKEIYDLLGKENGEIFCSYYGASIQGNFEGQNILHVVTDMETLAAKFKLPPEQIEEIIVSGKKSLLQAREKRVRPGLDDKIIASWNGLMLSAYARAYQVTGKKKYARIIKNNIEFIQDKMFVDGVLKRTCKKDQVKYDAFIEDYAFVVQALLDAWEALFDLSYLVFAINLADYANNHFWDKKSTGYFTTSDDQEKLVVRMKDAHDSSIPSATGVMLMNNLRLFSFTENKTYNDFAEQILKRCKSQLTENPYSFASYLAGVDFYLERPKEIVIVKNKNHDIEDYIRLIYRDYLPNKVVMVIDEAEDHTPLSASLIQDKKVVDGKVTVFVCQNFSCSLPVFKPEELKKLL